MLVVEYPQLPPIGQLPPSGPLQNGKKLSLHYAPLPLTESARRPDGSESHRRGGDHHTTEVSVATTKTGELTTLFEPNRRRTFQSCRHPIDRLEAPSRRIKIDLATLFSAIWLDRRCAASQKCEEPDTPKHFDHRSYSFHRSYSSSASAINSIGFLKTALLSF